MHMTIIIDRYARSPSRAFAHLSAKPPLLSSYDLDSLLRSILHSAKTVSSTNTHHPHPYYSPNSRLILSLTSLNPPTLLTRLGLAGPPRASVIAVNRPPPPDLGDGLGLPGAERGGLPILDGELGLAGGLWVGTKGPSSLAVAAAAVTVDGEEAGDDSGSFCGELGMAATAEGISSQSWRPTVLILRKKGQRSVSIVKDVCASAACQRCPCPLV